MTSSLVGHTATVLAGAPRLSDDCAPGPRATGDARVADATLIVGQAKALAFARVLDLVGDGVAFFTERGTLLAMNEVLEREIGPPALADSIRRQLSQAAARAATAVAEKPPENSENLWAEELRIGDRGFLLKVSYVRMDLFGAGGSILLVLSPIPDALSEASLRRRYGLSRQQCRVAMLLAEGCSNVEIAAELGISPHTARHHTEQVLMRLGVHSRAEAIGLLYRSPSRTPAGSR